MVSRVAGPEAQVKRLREALALTAEEARRAEIPEYNRQAFPDDGFNRGCDAAIGRARAALQEIPDV